MTTKEHLLVLLAEECNETAQRVSKALRFGLQEVQEGQDLTNAERIVEEYNDIAAIMELLFAHDLIPRTYNIHLVNAKKARLEKWIKYARECQTIQD